MPRRTIYFIISGQQTQTLLSVLTPKYRRERYFEGTHNGKQIHRVFVQVSPQCFAESDSFCGHSGSFNDLLKAIYDSIITSRSPKVGLNLHIHGYTNTV